MKRLANRVARLEKAAPPEAPAEVFDWSRVSENERLWFEAFSQLICPPGAEECDYWLASNDQLRMAEWLMEFAATNHPARSHEIGCRCEYCNAPFDGELPDIAGWSAA